MRELVVESNPTDNFLPEEDFLFKITNDEPLPNRYGGSIFGNYNEFRTHPEKPASTH